MKRLVVFLSLMAAMSAGGVAGAEESQPKGGGDVEQTWHREVGDFSAMLIVTDRYADFAKGWENPSQAGDGAEIELSDDTRRGDAVTATLTFAGCAPGIVGNCRCDADFVVLRPDGTTYSTHRNIEVWSQRPPENNNAQLSVGRMQLRLDSEDPLGTYTIRATVRDLVAKTEVKLEWPILVKPGASVPIGKDSWATPVSAPVAPAIDLIPAI